MYIEYISLKVFLYIFFKDHIKKQSKSDKCIVYYIDANRTILPLINYIGKIFNFEYNKLDFKMCQIVDSKGELVRIRIVRKDLFDFEKLIRNSHAYKKFKNNCINIDEAELFIIKGLLYASIHDKESPARMLYLINVIKWHKKLKNLGKVKFIIGNRPWLNQYRIIAKKFQIQVNEINFFKSPIFKIKKSLLKLVKNNTRLLIALRNIQNKRFYNFDYMNSKYSSLFYLEGRGDINFNNNGHHSDFFWQLNSKFPANKILYDSFGRDQNVLINNGIQCTNRRVKYYKKKFINPKRVGFNKYKKEKEVINDQILLYKSTREYWRALFKTYNVKIYSTWNNYCNNHMAKSDAINDLGGISIIQQHAFDGYKTYECSINADIVYRYSKWNCDVEEGLNSTIRYKIITGFIKDYAAQKVKKEALEMRKFLQSNGAEKIVFVIDENSADDNRWCTGHGLQRENYSYILNKMIEIPWLGVIFKPKYGRTLRKRLGEEIWNLLIAAKNTGRCYLYNSSIGDVTIQSPILAALSADVCIHGHTGNSALECALQNLPTLVIDREGRPYHKFHELPENKVIFNNWPDTINMLMEYFQSSKGVPGFGDWSTIINELDPFRDGKAANRIGTFNKFLLDGFDNGLRKEVILENAVQKYIDKWGSNKVITCY